MQQLFRFPVDAKDSLELRPNKKVEREYLTVMGVARQHQVDILRSAIPEGRPMHHDQIEFPLPDQFPCGLRLLLHRLVIPQSNDVHALDPHAPVIEICDPPLLQPADLHLVVSHIMLVIAGHEQDRLAYTVKRSQIRGFECARVE